MFLEVYVRFYVISFKISASNWTQIPWKKWCTFDF